MPLVFDNSLSDKLRTNRTSFSGADIRVIIQRPPYRISDANGNALYPGHEGMHHELGSLQTISIDSFVDKREVRSLGFRMPMGRTRGNSTIAGSLIFALLDIHPFNDTRIGDYTAKTSRAGILRASSGNLDLLDPWGTHFGTTDGDEVDIEGDIIPVQAVRKHQYDFTWDSQIFGDLMSPEELPPFDIIITFVNEAGGLGKIVLYGIDLHRQSMTMSIEDLFTEVVYSYTAKAMAQFEEGSFQGRLWNAPNVAATGDWAMEALRGSAQGVAGI